MIYITAYPLTQRINPMRKLLLTTATVAAAIAGAVAGEPSFGTITDTRDGKTYKTVKIGKQAWMAENLNYPTVRGSWCYENSADSCKKYGRLYEWYTAKTVCPSGWRLPDTADWEMLCTTTGKFVGKKLKSKSGWSNPGDGISGNGTNNYGFSALPGGFFRTHDRKFIDAGENCHWWTATEYGSGSACFRSLHNFANGWLTGATGKDNGHSVRCVADSGGVVRTKAGVPLAAEPLFGTLTDSRDGRTYRTVKIGRQTWMAQNLNYRTDRYWSYGDTTEFNVSYCYNNDTSYCDKYGRLYDWETALTACPAGYHPPSLEEWGDLINHAGGMCVYDEKRDDLVSYECGWWIAGTKLKARNGWNRDPYTANGTDDFGFSALPGGIRYSNGYSGGIWYSNGYFGNAGDAGAWWTADTLDGGRHAYQYIYYYRSTAEIYGNKDNTDDRRWHSVRCVADTP